MAVLTRTRSSPAKIKEELGSRFGPSVFGAHENISPTDEWQERILKTLKCWKEISSNRAMLCLKARIVTVSLASTRRR